MLGLTVSLICLLCAAAYLFLKRRYRYWKDLGILGPEPRMVVGNMMDIFSLKSTEPETMHQWYQEYRDEPYIGYYTFWKPALYIIDPELIRAITEFDFAHFSDHPEISTDAENDQVVNSLFTMKGADWKVKRQIFSRMFRPKKLRDFSSILGQHNDALLKNIDEQLESTDEIELLGIFEKQVLRIITSFLWNIDTSQDQACQSKLLELSEAFARPPIASVLRLIFMTAFPNLYKKLGLSTVSSVFWDYFGHFTNDLLNFRNGTNAEWDDLVALLARMKKERLLESEKIDHPEAVGHLFSFFIAGHQTTMTALSYVFYLLSLHPQVQEKLLAEVVNGNDSLIYTEAVINETFRLYPMLGNLKRICTIPYKINEKFTIPKGMEVILPVFSIQTDPEYYPEPEKFIPERFVEAETPQALFMPFGKGPRLCIGKRFAYISMKSMIAKVVSEYIILPGAKTRTPLQFDPKTFLLTVHPVDGLHVRLQKRKKTE